MDLKYLGCLTIALALLWPSVCRAQAAGGPGPGETHWKHDPNTPGEWFENGNWTGSIPTASVNAYVDNDGAAQIAGPGADGEAADLYVGYLRTGAVSQSARRVSVAEDIYIGHGVDANGAYALTGGTLTSRRMFVGGQAEANGGTGRLDIQPDGIASVSETLRIWGGGVVNIDGGTVRLGQPDALGPVDPDSAVIVEAGGQLSLQGGVLSGGTIVNNGTMSLSTQIESDVFGQVDNAAVGEIVLSGGAGVTFHDDLTNDGEIRVGAGSEAVYMGSVDGDGSFTGLGANRFEGELRPGHSLTAMSFGGSLVFGSQACLELELDGRGDSDPPGPQQDSLQVFGGDVHAGGTLELKWVPVAGDPNSRFGGVYNLITYGGQFHVHGEFAIGDELGAYVADIDYEVDLLLGIKAVQVTLHELLDGDADLNGKVDRADFLAIQAGMSAAEPDWFSGDFNFDGEVDSTDYLIWKENLGLSVAGTVPEPTGLALTVLGGAILMRRRRRRSECSAGNCA